MLEQFAFTSLESLGLSGSIFFTAVAVNYTVNKILNRQTRIHCMSACQNCFTVIQCLLR